MGVESKNYTIYNQKTGRAVAQLGSDGTLKDEGDAVAMAELRELLQREIIVRETADEEYEAFPEEFMCYFGLVTLRPGDAAYLGVFLRRLPYVSYYEARPASA